MIQSFATAWEVTGAVLALQIPCVRFIFKEEKHNLYVIYYICQAVFVSPH